MRSLLAVPLISLALGACAYPDTGAHSASTAEPDPATTAFVQSSCGRCHAVEGNAVSPNPQAPRFVDIANREWLTQESLATWLADAHNYPEMMEADLEPAQAKAIASYMFAMRSEEYQRLPD